MTDTHLQLLIQRVAQLRAEQATGEQQLAAIETRATDLRNTMLRISGAIQVLEELIAEHPIGDEAAAP